MKRREMLGLAGAGLVTSVFPARTAAAIDKPHFPVTVRHRHGETVITTEPRRVVCLGLNDQDFVYAVGISPLGVTEWWGKRPYATWPWAEPARLNLGAEPQVAGSRYLDYEWILSLEPDLILAVYRDLDERSYRKLSRIAPVVAAPAGYPAWTAPWDEQFALIARALGRSADATGMTNVISRRIERIRVDYPALVGRSAALADFREGQFVLWSNRTAPTRFIEQLGLNVPASLEALASPAGWIHISLEHAELLDLDLLIWPNDVRGLVEDIAVFTSLPVYRQGRCLWLSEEDISLSAALWFQSPLSITYLLDRLPPLILETLSR